METREAWFSPENRNVEEVWAKVFPWARQIIPNL